MLTRDYDSDDKNSGSTETHLAVDTKMRQAIDNVNAETSYEEGFASASGIDNETAETGGRIKHDETKDDARPARTPDSIEHENAGLADS